MKNNNEIISTFPKRFMNRNEIVDFFKSNNELIILSSYAKCSKESLDDFIVEKVWTENGKNEYGGSFNEYWIITKK